MSDEPGVTPPAPPADTAATQGVQPDPPPGDQGVTADSPAADRPDINMFRELQRRDQERSKQMDAILAWIGATGAQRQQAAAQPTPPASTEPSDDELWAQAQQGDRQAFEHYQRRIARREVTQVTAQQSRSNLQSQQLAVILNRYPVLRDPSHPLAQVTQQAYALLLRAGYPAGEGTLLEATKTAITDRPDLVSELYGQGAQARETTRSQASARAQSGVTGSTVRQGSAPPASPRLTRDEAALAERMGVKDPKAAKARFLKRQESGQSNLGAVGGYPSVIAEMEEFDK